MAIRKVYIANLGPFIYDDTEPIGHLGYGADELDPDFEGTPRAAIVTDGDIYGNIGTIGGLVVSVLTITDDHTLDPDADAVLLANAEGNKITVTLPTAVGIEGRLFWVKKVDSSRNRVTLKGNGVETIDGSNELDIVAQYDAPMVVSNNVNWMLI